MRSVSSMRKYAERRNRSVFSVAGTGRKGQKAAVLLSCSYADIMIQTREMNSSSPLLVFPDRIIPPPPTVHPGPWTARGALNQAAFCTGHWIGT